MDNGISGLHGVNAVKSAMEHIHDVVYVHHQHQNAMVTCVQNYRILKSIQLKSVMISKFWKKLNKSDAVNYV